MSILQANRPTHPSGPRLSDFADDEVVAALQRRTARHVDACSTCHGKVAFYRALDAAASSLPVPAPRRDLRLRILRRHAAGERTLLPALMQRVWRGVEGRPENSM